jgi:hypothetical protein
MTIERIACIWFCIIITPAVAAAQPGRETNDQVPASASKDGD